MKVLFSLSVSGSRHCKEETVEIPDEDLEHLSETQIANVIDDRYSDWKADYLCDTWQIIE